MRFRIAPQHAAQFGLLLVQLPAPLGCTARDRHGAPDQVHHRSAHAHLGIGGKAVFPRAAVAPRTFRQRDKARLHQVFQFYSGPAAAVHMPGEPLYHRQETPDTVCSVAPVSTGDNGTFSIC